MVYGNMHVVYALHSTQCRGSQACLRCVAELLSGGYAWGGMVACKGSVVLPLNLCFGNVHCDLQVVWWYCTFRVVFRVILHILGGIAGGLIAHRLACIATGRSILHGIYERLQFSLVWNYA